VMLQSGLFQFEEFIGDQLTSKIQLVHCCRRRR
jgi:hypothetical protein